MIKKSIIIACDVSFSKYKEIIKETSDIKKIGGYKIGHVLTGKEGYEKVVSFTRKHTDKPLIFDAQKWGTDIPDTAESILKPLKESGFDYVILFPLAGPVTEYEWIKTCFELKLKVFIGGMMTHQGYLEEEKIDQKYHSIFKKELKMNLPTGFIRKNSPQDIYKIASKMKVKNFIIPGNKPKEIKKIRKIIEKEIKSPYYASPGLITQGGSISDSAKIAGERWHAIVGRGIYKADNIREAALKYSKEL